jgi:DNA-binding beta-propeller fold protein YncE
LKKAALLFAALVLVSFGSVSCGGNSAPHSINPSKLTARIFASQSVSTPTALPGLAVINGETDTEASEISAGTSPGLMAISPERATVLAFDTATNNVDVVSAKNNSMTGSIPLPGPTFSMVVPVASSGYAAVPSAPMNQTGAPPGAVVAMNVASGGISATISVPGAQTVVASPDGTQILVFSNDSDVVTVIYPLLVNTGNNPVTVTVPGFDRPVYAVFSADGGTAYVLNCGAECGGTQASVQTLNFATTPPIAGAPVAVDGATVGLLAGSTLYVAGISTTNSACTGQTTAATTCGRLDILDSGSLAVTGTAVITDGYHDRIDISSNGQLFIGSHTCTTVGNVNNPQGEVRGCLSIYNTSNATVVIPPDNGDVTGLQSFSTRDVEYVAEGGNLRVYDTTIDSLLLNTTYIPNGTVNIPGQIIDVKAIDFF